MLLDDDIPDGLKIPSIDFKGAQKIILFRFITEVIWGEAPVRVFPANGPQKPHLQSEEVKVSQARVTLVCGDGLVHGAFIATPLVPRILDTFEIRGVERLELIGLRSWRDVVKDGQAKGFLIFRKYFLHWEVNGAGVLPIHIDPAPPFVSPKINGDWVCGCGMII